MSFPDASRFICERIYRFHLCTRTILRMCESHFENTISRLPLAGVRVVDLSTPLGSYVGRLYSDLGAEVVRVEPAEGLADRRRGAPTVGDVGAEWVFHNVGKKSVVIDDVDAGLDSPTVVDLLRSAQILLTSEGPESLRGRGLEPDTVAEVLPHLVHINISPYGLDGPWTDRPADDLTILAAGGLLALAGDPDRAPVRPAECQSAVAASLHGAIGGLIALLAQEGDHVGQTVDVSAQEAVAHSLENAIQYYDLEGSVRTRAGSAPKEAGTGLFACADGWLYVVGGLGGYPLGWAGIIDWFDECGVEGADALRADRWQDRLWRRTPEAITEFRTYFEQLTVSRTKEELYEAGQRHGVSVAPVSMPQDLLDNPQLVARNYFRSATIDGIDVTIPGPPYRFDGANIGPGPAVAGIAEHTEAVFTALAAD
ncbi:CaiB/BaiF CoA transferase family protein [Rhodococcus opacus]|uniref:CaiB/BaiF CoA transferase family protein n=2 Tax=Rhodococcus opacus TaxID=37919 RepID=UPI00146DDA87|nr:CaiB/BaiF CoA-transferase family protein [Rhodococcus opacus]MDJ0420237.1 CaiB/BaiF CoA-transferase family protein [Rhodococcus opacus]